MNESPAPVVSTALTLIPSTLAFSPLKYRSAPLLPLVKISSFGSVFSNAAIPSASESMPVMKANSSSLIFRMSAYGRNSWIVCFSISGSGQRFKRTFGSKTIVPPACCIFSKAARCAYFTGASIRSTEQKCRISAAVKTSSFSSSLFNNISALGLR